MINSDAFAKRLQEIIEFYGESASSFANKIGVQRSSISHILSGRNKPSLEFVLKILTSYPEVELYWLLNGKGKFPSSSAQQSIQTITNPKQDLATPPPEAKKTHGEPVDKTIDKIVIFYKDGTFKEFVKN